MEGFFVMSLGGLYLELIYGTLFLRLVEHSLTLQIKLFSCLYHSIHFCNCSLLMYVLVSS